MPALQIFIPSPGAIRKNMSNFFLNTARFKAKGNLAPMLIGPEPDLLPPNLENHIVPYPPAPTEKSKILAAPGNVCM